MAKEGWKLLTLRLVSGGNKQNEWIQVPRAITGFDDVLAIIRQTKLVAETYERAERFGLSPQQIEHVRPELFGYSLGMMVGDAGKLGGQQQRFASMNIDLQLTRLEPTNQALGEFACMCFNSIGIGVHRIKDKEPSGMQLSGRNPTPAFRWTSKRSPLLAWMFSVCLGLKWNENTSNDEIHMDWIFDSPFEFRRSFAQALADSVGSVRNYVVEITSVPNAEFVTKLMHSVGLTGAYTRIENGNSLRTVVSAKEAANLPLFNSYAKGYRYQKLQRYAQK
jgi:hypothetical protein